jgi:hypothetical protein
MVNFNCAGVAPLKRPERRGASVLASATVAEPPISFPTAEVVDRMGTQTGYSVEHVQRYRNGAIEAENLASPCEDSELRDAYLSIAKNWAELADKIERSLRAKRKRRPG